jgi:hypothetical protein
MELRFFVANKKKGAGDDIHSFFLSIDSAIAACRTLFFCTFSPFSYATEKKKKKKKKLLLSRSHEALPYYMATMSSRG